MWRTYAIGCDNGLFGHCKVGVFGKDLPVKPVIMDQLGQLPVLLQAIGYCRFKFCRIDRLRRVLSMMDGDGGGRF